MKVSLNATVYCHGDGKFYTAQQAVSLLPLEPGGALMLSHTAASEEAALQGLALKLAGHVAKCGATEITTHETVVEVSTKRGELAVLMDAERKRAEEATEHFVGTPPPVRRLEVVIDDYLHGILAAALEALKPLAAIADAYHESGLDEARPEWVANGAKVFDPDVELYCGRGGKQLLTLQHALDAKNVLERGVSEEAPSAARYKKALLAIGKAATLNEPDSIKLHEIQHIVARALNRDEVLRRSSLRIGDKEGEGTTRQGEEVA